MSALLAALKKAAEEKQKKGGASLKGSPVKVDQDERTAGRDLSPSLSSDTEPKQSPFQLNFAEGMDASPEMAVSPLADEKEESAHLNEGVDLNFVDDITIEDPLNEAHIAPLTDESEASEAADSSMSDLSAATDEAPNSPELQPKGSMAGEKPHGALNQSDNTPVKETPNAVLNLQNKTEAIEQDDLSTSVENTEFNVLKMAGDNVESQSQPRLDLETSLALNEGDSPSADLSLKVTDQQAEPDATASPGRAESGGSGHAPTDSTQSEQWSLDQIPGYQQSDSSVKEDQARMQNVLQTTLSPKTNNAVFSIKHWWGLLAVLVVVGLGYYGLTVYEREALLVDQALRPYQSLTQKTLPVNKPSSGEDNTVLKASQSLQQQDQSVQQSGDTSPMTNSVLDADSANHQQANSEKLTAGQKMAKELAEETVKNSTKVPVKKIAKPDKKTPDANADRNNHLAAGKTLQKTAASNPKLHIEALKPNTEVYDGYQAYRKGDFAAAESYYQQAYQADPESLPVLFGLAATAAKKGESQKALRLYQKILKASPNNADALIAEASLQASMNNEVGIVRKLQDLMQRFPKAAPLSSALGHQFARNQNWVDAQKYYFKAYQLAPENGHYAHNLAVSLDRLGQYDLAKTYYEQALAKTRDDNPRLQQQIKSRLLAINQYLVETVR
ncbi:MAG: hypothetical protein COZ36_04465 [Piscirickettsiaceae bacterium CG_4_10_14_3_um_filter_44_349]|nr:MAG: hypothetical protein COW14_09860 [Piscirickettsiaceae bacterium CG12_big_fil_rev_8_21_14_0_65_44_934]PIX79603.1 MAG: hypothetical protein COZ36_04465 [Piscirickettsiaceae bacterium CG_4_10_14_3_um_filter_44_349]